MSADPASLRRSPNTRDDLHTRQGATADLAHSAAPQHRQRTRSRRAATTTTGCCDTDARSVGAAHAEAAWVSDDTLSREVIDNRNGGGGTAHGLSHSLWSPRGATRSSSGAAPHHHRHERRRRRASVDQPTHPPASTAAAAASQAPLRPAGTAPAPLSALLHLYCDPACGDDEAWRRRLLAVPSETHAADAAADVDAGPRRTRCRREVTPPPPSPPRRWCRDPLQRLLADHPADAAACLSFSLGLVATLEAMRVSPPPPLPTEVLKAVAAATAMDAERLVHACSEAWSTTTAAAAGSTAAPLQTTCACGCVVGGQLLDPALYSFHLGYYHRCHRRRSSLWPPPLPSSLGVESGAAAVVSAVAPVEAQRERVAFAEAVAEQQRRWRHLSVGSSAAHTSATGIDVPSTALLPLLAVDTLARFVSASSMRRSSALARRRRRWRRLWRWAPSQESCGGAATTTTTTTASPADAYGAFCNETERLWATVACVLLSWKQLESCASAQLFAPRLMVLQALPQPPPPDVAAASASPLARVAAALRLPTAAVACMLVQAPPQHLTASAAPVGFDGGAGRLALARLRVHLLSMESHAAASTQLRDMEAFVHGELDGAIAQLPLWCAVAVEVVQMHAEHSGCSGGGGGGGDVAAWPALHPHRVRQVVLLAVRLMSLVNSCAAAAAATRQVRPHHRSKRRGRTRLPPPPSPRHGGGRRRGGGGAAVAEASSASPSLSAASLEELSDTMTRHPLFGVAVAVVGARLPLLWAGMCVAPQSVSAATAATTGGVDSAVVAELRRLVQRVHAWLQEAEGQ